jgi:hypothetical protein
MGEEGAAAHITLNGIGLKGGKEETAFRSARGSAVAKGKGEEGGIRRVEKVAEIGEAAAAQENVGSAGVGKEKGGAGN